MATKGMATAATKAKKVMSPTSVLVVVDEEGAEVVFNDTGSGAIKPKAKSRVSLKSLLDEEQSVSITPTRPERNLTKRTPSSGADVGLCCTKIEDTIDAFLSKPIRIGASVNDWQMWSYFSMGRSSPYKGTDKVAKEDARKVLRKRFFFSANERRRRMDSVRKDHSPFTLTPTRPTRGSRLKTVKSFDIVAHRSKRTIPQNQTNQTSISSIVSMCGVCNAHKPDSPAAIRSRMLDAVSEDDDCYDSDPEDFTRHRLFQKHSPSMEGRASNKENLHNKGNRSTPARKMPSSMDSEDYIFNSVQEFLNERFTLILHTQGGEAKPCAPCAVKAWFERGQHLSSNKVIQPRFLWHKVERKRSNRHVALPNAKQLSGFDVVDVARVLAVDSLDRNHHPFAASKPEACFLIKTWEGSKNGSCWLFEAASKPERERIVRWMKLVVARLASKLIVGDNSLFEEFFAMGMPETGPGGAPS